MSLKSWFSSLNSPRRRTRKSSRLSRPRASARLALFEPLEDRRLLALTVFGTSDPWLAGMPNGATASGGSTAPANSPILAGSAVTAGQVFTFSATGLAAHGAGLFSGPDGRPGVIFSHTGTPSNGIGGYTGQINALVGVFLNDSQPNTTGTPPALNFSSNMNFTSLSPQLKQPFFIGDGKTSGNVIQQFVAPAGATRLFLGMFDAYGYSNNLGSFTVNVGSPNSTPIVRAGAAAVTANEGGSVSNTGTFSDQDGNSTVTMSASVGTVTQNSSAGTWSWSLNAADGPASGFVTITARDNQNAAATATFSYSVNNIAPTISLSGNATVDEGSPYTLNLGVVTDPGQDTITSYKINWGDGVIDSFTGNPANTTVTHTYADGPNNQTHRVSVTDEDGTVVAGELSVLVLNVAPTIALTGADSVDEGSPYTLNLGAITDPGTDTVTAYSIDWGDGSAIESFSGNPASTSKTHTYADGTSGFLVRVSLTDEDGTYLDAGTKGVTVNNVAPTTPAETNSAANEVTENAANGTLVGITAASTDPGILDTVTYRLTNDAGGRFSIHATTGVVTVANGALLDYETATSHSITVEASDGQDASTQNFTINLLNVTAVISGTIFVDVNGNGLFDGGTESALDGVTVKLLDSALTELAQDVTEFGGVYVFTVNDEFGTYRIREIQPTGVTDGAAVLGSAAVDSVFSSNEMQLTLAGADASDYDFTEVGQAVQSGDTATIGFWQNKNGQTLIQQAGPALVPWLNANFGNIFGSRFADGVGGDNPAEVASFYKAEFFDKKLKGTSKVDAQFMSLALATFFTSRNLSGGSVAASYGFNVTETGNGAKVVNVGSSGAAFGVANNTNMTIMSLLLATNRLTGADANGDGYSHAYDANGDGVLDDAEKALRALANTLYTAINENGDI